MRTIIMLLSLLAPALAAADVGQIKTLAGDVRIERAGRTLPAAAGDGLLASDVPFSLQAAPLLARAGRAGSTVHGADRKGVAHKRQREAERRKK